MSDETYETAKRIAGLDGIDVQASVNSVVPPHAEYLDLCLEASAQAIVRFGRVEE